MKPGYRQNPRAAGVRAPWNGTTTVPQNLPPILRANEPPPPTQAIQVLDRVVIEDKTYLVKWVEINATAAGNTTVVQGVGGKKLTVVSVELVVSAAVSIGWFSGTNQVRQAQAFAANSGIARDIVRPFYVQTFGGEALIINLSGVANVRGAIGYAEVEA
jgi:hypothetical protein